MAVQFDGNMFQQFNLGDAVKSGQQITYNRFRNDFLGDQQTERREARANRIKAQQIRTMYDKMPAQIEALEAESMFDEADNLRGAYIDTRKSEIDLLTGMRPAINADNYKPLRQDLLQSGAITPEMMPVEYSDEWFRNQIDEKKGKLETFTVQSYQSGAVMSRDYVQQDGTIKWEGAWYDSDPDSGSGGKGGGKGWTFKAADANQIGDQIERLFGGFYDPQTRQLKGLDPKQTARIQSIQEEAERLYTEAGGSLPHGVAVSRAARSLGIKIQDYRDESADNPLNLDL